MPSWDWEAMYCIMRKIFVSCLLLCSTFSFAQKETVTIKTGTTIEVEAAQTVQAKNVEVGDMVRFRVTSPVMVNGKTAIPAGSMVEARVTEAKKSSLAGTKGRLEMNFSNLVLRDGTKAPLSGSCRVYGKNRTPLSVITALFVAYHASLFLGQRLFCQRDITQQQQYCLM